MLIADVKNEFELDCRVRKLSERTIKNYRMLLSIWVRYEREIYKNDAMEQVTSSHVKNYILYLINDGKKPQYVNDNLKVLKVFFKYALEEGHIVRNPTERVHNVKQPKVLIRTFSEHEIRGMIEYYKGNDFLSVRNKTMLALFFDTGMRLAEVLTLTEKQIYPDYILVHGKGSKERMVPVSPYLAKLLLKYRTVYNGYFCEQLPPAPYVFVSRYGKKLTPEAVTKFMKKAADDIGVSPDVRVSPHTCRHTFAHQQLKNGLDLYSLSRLMGHENIAITQRYLDGIRNDEVLEKARATGVLQNL